MRMKTFPLLLLAGLALLAGSSAASAAGGMGPGLPRGVVPHRGVARVAPWAPNAAAVSGGGATCGISCSSYQAGIDKYFTDIGAAAAANATDNVYSVTTQYSGITYGSSFGGSVVDTNAFPANGCTDTYTGASDSVCLDDVQLQTEIRSVITAQGWPTGTNDLFFVFTPSDVGICFDPGSAASGDQCSTNAFCAYHNDTLLGTSHVIYGVEPDDKTIPSGGCDYKVQTPNNAYVDPTLNTVSHEQSEALTDPLTASPAWLTPTGYEIGDLCAWTFGTPVTQGGNYNQVINGDHYWLQQEYSNADKGCVQYRGGPRTVPSTGTGPLVDRGGPVMHTNVDYAIYWFPGPPTSVPSVAKAPVVSGVPVVGKTLTTSDGSWNNSPAGYAFRWQTCSATGTGCIDIPGATAASYVLAPTDAGREIRSEVSAHNAIGSSAYAPSAPTPLVATLPVSVAAPVVSGAAAVGKTLSTTTGTWTAPASYAYEWLRCSATGTSCSSISGAAAATYKLKAADAGHALEARVSATNAAGTAAAVSAPTGVVLGPPHANVKPQISGTAKVGKILSAGTGSWTNSPTSYAYQWLRCSTTGTSCLVIPHATGATYKLTRRDAHHRLRVRVTATNAAGSATSTSGTTRTATRH